MFRFILTVASPIILANLSLGFAPHAFVSRRNTMALFASTAMDNDESMMFVLREAQECVEDETCNIETAAMLLDKVLDSLNQCGSTEQPEEEVCDVDDMMFMANDAVAGLRMKVNAQGNTAQYVDQINSSGMTSAVTLTQSLPLSVLAVALGSVALVMMQVQLQHPGAERFTLYEWWWAINGGFFDDMVAHYLRNGGL